MTAATGSPPTAAASRPAFVTQLRAVLRARRAVSACQRQESPASWWLKRLLIGAGGAALVVGSLVTSFAISLDANADPARVAVLYFLGPVGVAMVLMAARLRPESSAHPLGEARLLVPLSRWRAAFLAVSEELLSVETLFVAALGWAPWLSTLAAGESPLNAAGWCSALLAPAAAVGLRQILLALQSWAMTATEGAAAAVLRVAYVLLFVGLPWLLSAAGRLFNVGDIDLFALPLLAWARSPAAPFAILAAAAAMIGLSAFIRSRRPPAWLRRLSESMRLPRFNAGTVSFGHAGAAVTMFRMMAVQATRIPAYRHSALMFVVFAALALAFRGGPFATIVLATAFYAPISGLYNLYGADSRHYVLWLASGRSLRDWTAARQLFFASYFAVFTVPALAVLAAGGRRPELVLGLAPAAVLALLIAAIAGPLTSRFVISAHVKEVGRRARPTQSGRSWVAAVCTALTAAGAGGLGVAAAVSGLWWALWLAVPILGVVLGVVRPARTPWTWELRDRMALAFRD